MLWGSREYDGLVLDFIGAFDLRGCIYNLRCPKDGRHRIHDATKNFLCKRFCRKPGVERSVQKAARPLNSVWMGGPEEEQLGCSPRTEGCIL